MKKLLLIITTLLIGPMLFAQEQKDSTVITKDTSYTIEWGKKTIIIIDAGEDDEVDSSDSTNIKISIGGKKRQRHNHFAGIDFGWNGMVNDAMSVDLRDGEKFMDQNYYGSWFLSINFLDSYIPIFQEKLGLTIGMGVEFNKYKFSRDYTLANVSDSTIAFRDSSINLDKNLLKSTFISLPIFLETNLGKDADHSFHLMAGAMISYRLGSKTKQVYTSDGEDYKTKVRNDFNMNDFRVSLVGRIGYGNFTLFASYSLTPFYQDGRGPELYPFTVGVSLVHF